MGEMECVLGQGGGDLQERAWLFGGSEKPAGTGFVSPVVNSLCGATLGLLFGVNAPLKSSRLAVKARK